MSKNEEHIAKMREKYKIISDKGLDIDQYIETRERARVIAWLLGDGKDYRKEGRKYTWINSERTYKNGKFVIKYRLERSNDETKWLPFLTVTYDGLVLMDNYNYLPGEWEKYVEELDKYLPILMAEKRRKNTTFKNISYLKSIFKYEEELTISKTVTFQKYSISEAPSRISSNRYTEDGIKVISDGKTVFLEAIRIDENTDSVENRNKYIPGDWEKQIDIFIKKRKEEEQAELELKSHHFFDEQIKILKPKKR